MDTPHLLLQLSTCVILIVPVFNYSNDLTWRESNTSWYGQHLAIGSKTFKTKWVRNGRRFSCKNLLFKVVFQSFMYCLNVRSAFQIMYT